MLNSLVSFFTLGEVRDYLLNAIAEARMDLPAQKGTLPRFKMPRWIESWIRVPPMTWLLSGLTIVVSVIGFLFMRGRGNKKDQTDQD